MEAIEILKLIKDYYSKEGNAVGGSLHMVLDDGNLDNSDIQFAINYAKKEMDCDGIKIGEILLSLSKGERKKIYKKTWM